MNRKKIISSVIIGLVSLAGVSANPSYSTSIGSLPVGSSLPVGASLPSMGSSMPRPSLSSFSL